MLKKLLATVALICALVAPMAAHATDTQAAKPFPSFMRGNWCYAGSIDNHGSKVKTFKRGSCTGNTLAFTAYSLLSKWGTMINECRAYNVEDTGRGSWIINMTCEGEEIKQFFYPMINNRLGVMDMEDN